MNIKLVKNYNQIRPDRATLFCFPFAGGGASAYNSWVQKMKDKVTVCPIQLPGREERIMDKPYNNMTDMLDELEETIWKCIRGPYAFWGHSMGGQMLFKYENEIAEIGFSEIAGAGRNKRKAKVSELNNIRILADTSAVELYLNDGEIVFSTRYYPDREDLQLKVKGGKFMGNLWNLRKMIFTK